MMTSGSGMRMDGGAVVMMITTRGGIELVDFLSVKPVEGTAMAKQRGFTLIELVVVIVILGILAATALPRFVNLQTDARRAAVNGFAGGLRGAVAIVNARWLATGSTGSALVTMADTTTVAVSTGASGGIPTGATGGIGNAIRCSGVSGTDNCGGFVGTYASPTSTFWPVNGGSATCGASYNDTSGNVTVDTTTC